MSARKTAVARGRTADSQGEAVSRDGFTIGTTWQSWRPPRRRAVLAGALAILASWVAFLAWMMAAH